MKAPWVVLVATMTLVVGLVTGSLAGFVLGLWAGGESATANEAVADVEPVPLPQLSLEVFDDGCGVVRSEAPPGVEYRMLTWVIRDGNGFQVLGRAAEGETRYRYFRPGQYTVVLEAHDGTSYQSVSNEVAVTC